MVIKKIKIDESQIKALENADSIEKMHAIVTQINDDDLIEFWMKVKSSWLGGKRDFIADGLHGIEDKFDDLTHPRVRAYTVLYTVALDSLQKSTQLS